MATKAILVGSFTVFCVVIALTIQRGCIGEQPSKAEVVTKLDTFKIPAIHDTLRTTKIITRTIGGFDIHDTTILQKIDTVFKREGIKELTACADTILQDTFRICFNYVSRSFDVRVNFAPRVKTDTIIFPARKTPFLTGAPFIVADLDLNSQIYLGVGYGVNLLGHLNLDASVGLNRSPFQATAHVTGRWNF